MSAMTDDRPPVSTADLLLHFDGGCTRNPGGTMTYGFHLDTTDGRCLANGRGRVDGYVEAERTNNTAEFHGLLNGLAAVVSNAKPGQTVEVRGDSQLVVNVASGEWSAKKPHLAKLAVDVRGVVDNLRRMGVSVSFAWVERRFNKRADQLAASA